MQVVFSSPWTEQLVEPWHLIRGEGKEGMSCPVIYHEGEREQGSNKEQKIEIGRQTV